MYRANITRETSVFPLRLSRSATPKMSMYLAIVSTPSTPRTIDEDQHRHHPPTGRTNPQTSHQSPLHAPPPTAQDRAILHKAKPSRGGSSPEGACGRVPSV